MASGKDTIKAGTDNLFADLGYPEPDTHLLKAELVSRIHDLVLTQKLTQTEAAKRMGISQPDVSRMLKGRFRDLSVERLMRLLTRLGCEVDIIIRDRSRPRAKAKTIRLHPAA
jgi:predicted XRE-type DNA-binding protein